MSNKRRSRSGLLEEVDVGTGGYSVCTSRLDMVNRTFT